MNQPRRTKKLRGRPKASPEALKATGKKRIRTLKARKEKIVPRTSVAISKSAPNPKFYFVEGVKKVKRKRKSTALALKPKARRKYRRVGSLSTMSTPQIKNLVKDVLIGAGVGVGYKYVANQHLYPLVGVTDENMRMGLDAAAGVGLLLASRAKKLRNFRKYLISGGTAVLTLTAFELYTKLLKNTQFGKTAGYSSNIFNDVSGYSENVFKTAQGLASRPKSTKTNFQF